MQAGTIVGNLASAIGITTEDAALVADLKAGSESAFALLIAQYHQPLYSLIARSLNDPADAADITQEVFIKVFRSIRGFHGDTGLCPSAPLAHPADSPFDHAAQAEVRERVEAALRQLPEAFRTVVILREIEGFAYEEIAQILSVNLGTVKSRLTRGRSALRSLLSIQSAIPSTNTASYPPAETSKELVTR